VTPTISIVVPVFGGEATVGPLVQALVEVLGTESLEIVLVNDASPDDSERACLELVANYPDTVVYAALARNFGEHNAVMAGLRLARGDFVVTIDDDLQNPPSEVPRLLKRRGAATTSSTHSSRESSTPGSATSAAASTTGSPRACSASRRASICRRSAACRASSSTRSFATTAPTRT
jgi:glycosyltransferase involved in cell wall biosynthesis